MCPCSVCVQYAKPLLHSDIRSYCRQSTHVLTSRYLLGHAFFTLKMFLDEKYYHFCKVHIIIIDSYLYITMATQLEEVDNHSSYLIMSVPRAME